MDDPAILGSIAKLEEMHKTNGSSNGVESSPLFVAVEYPEDVDDLLLKLCGLEL